MNSRRRRKLRRGIYLLPSAFTISNILLGFYAMVCGLRGDFPKAAVVLIAAGILDSLDGRIARLTRTESEFGREFDSLADVVTFGVGPAFLTHVWGLSELGRAGWLVPLFFLVCAATRLARFNVQTTTADSRWFVGLPVPAAAGTIAALLFFAPDREWRSWITALFVAALLIVGILMVSTFRYWSLKEVHLRRRWSYRVVLPLAAAILVVAKYPPALFLLVVLYSLSGPILWAWGRLRAWGTGEKQGSASPEAPAVETGEAS